MITVLIFLRTGPLFDIRFIETFITIQNLFLCKKFLFTKKNDCHTCFWFADLCSMIKLFYRQRSSVTIDWSSLCTSTKSLNLIDWSLLYTSTKSLNLIDWSLLCTSTKPANLIDWSPSYTSTKLSNLIDWSLLYTSAKPSNLIVWTD